MIRGDQRGLADYLFKWVGVYPFFSRSVYKGGKETNFMSLDKRIKALIAIGASVAANCQPCLQSTVSMARKAGADDEQIAEAVEVGTRVRKGAAAKMDRFSAELGRAASQGVENADATCGCD
jgi:AhpD family alkylhydroperoxidase